jgi:hypothetical protein
MDVLCLFSGIRFQAEFEKEAQLQNNGETATVDDLAVDVKQRSMLANFQRFVVE